MSISGHYNHGQGGGGGVSECSSPQSRNQWDKGWHPTGEERVVLTGQQKRVLDLRLLMIVAPE